MEQEKWGIVGIGTLGGAILKQLSNGKPNIGFYHPNAEKAAGIAQANPGHQSLTVEELDSFDFLILALPADRLVPFVQSLLDSGLSLTRVTLINMATVVKTAELNRQFPQLRFLGMKFMGHAVDLRERGNGLFITEPNERFASVQERAIRFFEHVGQVIVDKEDVVEEVNSLATRIAVKAAFELEHAIREGGYRQEYASRALVSVAPEVMRAYASGTMGHFARKIVEQLMEEQQES
ncbi:NAD(P)-binding domain-containing protein [Brevibacillus centrosporus]|uniref:NAD(P)-binding domain-containing protein n=1 Tax=Brevibacillus centrosporus TaxID=54910 RepID=UPI003B02C5F8